MPLYEYRCGQCGHEIEVLQKISAAAPVECPACHQPALQKKVTAAGFQLKGTGWYATDFRSSGARPEATKPAEGGKPEASPAATGDAGKAAASAGTPPAAAPAAGSTGSPPAPTDSGSKAG